VAVVPRVDFSDKVAIFMNSFNWLTYRRADRQGGLSAPGSPSFDFSGGLAGGGAFTDIARFGARKIELLRRFLPYVNRTPSHDHLGDIFATLDAPRLPALLRGLGRCADEHIRRGHRD